MLIYLPETADPGISEKSSPDLYQSAYPDTWTSASACGLISSLSRFPDLCRIGEVPYADSANGLRR